MIRWNVHSEDCSYQRVLRASAVSGRAESRIAPRAGPHVRRRVDLGVVMSLLVTHQSPIWSRRPIHTVLPASLPEHYVSTEERQMNAFVARSFHIGPLSAGPVFI